MKLSDPIDSISGIGPKISEAFKQKEIVTIRDLLLYVPRKYDDFSHIVPIRQIKPGQATIKAKINNVKTHRARRGLSITEAIANDETDSIRLVWFNQPYRQSGIKTGEVYYISGLYKLSNHHYAMINPSIELESGVPINSARIVPVYPESKNLNSNIIRRAVSKVLPLAEKLKEIMPEYIIKDLGLCHFNWAISQIHFPQNAMQLEKAKLRLQFNELFPLLLANELSTRQRLSQRSPVVAFKVDLARSFVAKLPFELTDDQRRVIWQIYKDMQSDLPMNRLVEGDVGSGKTVVAVMAAVMAIAEGFSVAFMAPTELLARQHYSTVKSLLRSLAMDDKLILLTGSMSKKLKDKTTTKANAIKGTFIVGTHSLLTSNIDYNDLALIIIDEQHRFGVDQRMTLQKQTGHLPHFLSLTATPIPRSLALTILSDLNISRLKTMPDKRKTISTELVAPSSFNSFIGQLRQELASGRQAYIVCPYIHSKDKTDKQSLEYVFAQIQILLNEYKVSIIHGQLNAKEQESVMKNFVNNKIKVLVATTVIEVGVDVANATVMAIYGPDRFGLAQLHQLRGRVGRGVYASHCYLILNDASQPSPRLREFVHINDGFKLSELDLKLRGPGAIYGKLQHGKSGLNLLTLDDAMLINVARKAVEIFFETDQKLLEYKSLMRLVEQAQQLTYLN